MNRILIVAALLLSLALPTTASAHMQLGIQDDGQMLFSAPTADAYLQRADTVHARWIRIMVTENVWNNERPQLMVALTNAKAHHKRVMVSLLAWQSNPTPDQWRAFALEVAPAIAPYVDAWSPLNEPNCFGFMTRGGPTGPAYGRLWDHVAPILRYFDPSAKLVAGDTCPNPDGAKIMRWFFKHRHPVTPDVMGIHPYYDGCAFKHHRDGSWRLPDVGDAVRLARQNHVRVWATEWAQWPDQPAACWVTSLNAMRRAGVRKVFIYDTPGKSWDTQMRPAALAAVAQR